MMLAALSAYHAGLRQLVVFGDERSTRALLDVTRKRYQPHGIVIRMDPTHRETLARLLPWTGAMTMRGGRPTAYLCRAFTCDAPVTAPDELEGLWSSF